MKYNLLVTTLFLSLVLGTSAFADRSIVNSKHNLSVSGPGEIRALAEDRICIFCHTPHNATPFTPLWNKKLEPTTYTLYQSSTLSAIPQQPNGPLPDRCHRENCHRPPVRGAQHPARTGSPPGAPDSRLRCKLG